MRVYRRRQPPLGKDSYKAKYLEAVAEVERLTPGQTLLPSVEVKPCHFVSRYKGITYRIPTSVVPADNKGNAFTARFVDGEYITTDGRIISYLRGHRDYGFTLTEA